MYLFANVVKALKWVKSTAAASLTKQKRTGRLLFMGLMLVITTGLLGWLVYRQKEALLAYQWQFRPGAILLSFVVYTLTLFLATLVWYRIITALGNRLNFAKNFRYFCITNLGKRLPGSVWYVPWRARMYQEQGLSLQVVSIASSIELVIMVISGVIVSLLFAAPSLGLLNQNLIAIGAVLLLVLLALLHPTVIRRISRLFHVSTEQVQYRQILQWVLLYSLTWVTGGSLLFCVTNIFIPLDVAHLPYVIGAWSLTGVLSMSLLLLPSNLGMTEISLTLFLSVLMPLPVAVVVAVGMRILVLLYDIVWAGIAIWHESRDQHSSFGLIKGQKGQNNP